MQETFTRESILAQTMDELSGMRKVVIALSFEPRRTSLNVAKPSEKKRPPTEVGERTRPGVPRRPGLGTGTVCAAGRSVSAHSMKVWGSRVDLSQMVN